MPEIEFVAVANHAEAINNLLYLQGAGWTEIQQPISPDGVPGIVHFGIAVSLLIGWTETNRRFPLTLTVNREDGQELIGLGAQVEAGRPPGTPEGADIRNVLAVNAEAQFPESGGYELRAKLGDKIRSVAFRVRQLPIVPSGGSAVRFPQPPT